MKKIIIDANCSQKVKQSDADGLPVLSRLLNARLKLCVCNELKEELAKTPILEIMTELTLAGLVVSYGDTEIDSEKEIISERCRSNDHHIVALARLAGCRVLFSHDKPLHADFTDLDLVPLPRGRIYQTRLHSHLLD